MRCARLRGRRRRFGFEASGFREVHDRDSRNRLPYDDGGASSRHSVRRPEYRQQGKRWTNLAGYGNIRLYRKQGSSRAVHSETRAHSLPRHGADFASAGRPAGDAASPADGAALQACLALAKKNEEARGLHGPDELAEKTGRKGRLDAAREAAPRQAESCIGVVSTACIQAEGNESTAVMLDCYGREANAWDGRLNAAYKQALKSGDGDDVVEGFRKVQRAWIAFRDASCAQPAIVFKGSMAAPMEAYRRLDMTARQALWLERWAQ